MVEEGICILEVVAVLLWELGVYGPLAFRALRSTHSLPVLLLGPQPEFEL